MDDTLRHTAKDMAFDDPIVWVLIIAVVIFLFGANKIPSLARSIGQARREFDKGWKGQLESLTSPNALQSSTVDDPVVVAAQKEGIETAGKTREQIASELAWKINKK